jgi:DNA-binding beta-propeller fold protein YncE
MKTIVLSIMIVLLFAAAASLFAQTSAGPAGDDRNAVLAREEFRLGVLAYNRYSFNEAIFSFERALSYLPGEPLILEWLGRSYYRSGMEDTALRQWQSAMDMYEGSIDERLLLGSRIETVRNRRSLFPELDIDSRYVESGSYPSVNGEFVLYRQPSSVLALDNGSVWVAAYGSNELVQIDVNGIIKQRIRGPLNGFDRPFDIARGPDGRLYVSEYRGGRISVLSPEGEWLSYIGSKGRGDGNLIGPQNLCLDADGYLYVIDYGNGRVVKFSPEGEFLLSFGSMKIGDFPGLRSPTGIALRDNQVFVSDGISRRIYFFDQNGMYQGTLVRDGLLAPESMRFTEDGQLLVADANRVLIINPDTGVIRELGAVGNASMGDAASRIVGIDTDKNGNILAANFDGGEVSILTRIDDMAAGLFVQIERVVAERFPLVTVEVSVQDRLRRPLVGLDANNFILSEEGRVVAEQQFLGASYQSVHSDISILIEGSPQMRALQDDLAVAVRDASSAADRVVSIVSAGEQPVKVSVDSVLGGDAAYTDRWRFDLGLRLAATDLLPGEKKRAVVFVTTGEIGGLGFDQYGLSELAAYLANNGIVFYAVMAGGNAPGPEIQYLCRETGGEAVPLYRPEGIKPVIEKLRNEPSGTYLFQYRSVMPTDFGRAYLPVEAEVYLLERSGRDATGYFPPLE